jgi:hypothetical protein
MTATPVIKMVDPNEVLNKVNADKSVVQLDSTKHSEDSATITSEVPGEVKLAVRPHGIDGLTVKIENDTLKPGQPGVIRFIYEPPDESAKAPRIVYVHANPLNKVFSFTLNFRQPTPAARPTVPFPGQQPAAPAKRP